MTKEDTQLTVDHALTAYGFLLSVEKPTTFDGFANLIYAYFEPNERVDLIINVLRGQGDRIIIRKHNGQLVIK